MIRRNPELYEKYRPMALEDLVGREDFVAYIKRRMADPKYSRDALMFLGDSGTGKTTAARIIANLFAKHEMDIIELPGTRIGSVDVIRDEVAPWLRTMAWGMSWKVLIVDEAQGMSQPAKETFLDLIENSPERRLVIFTATRTPDLKIPFSKALTSRFKVFQFGALPPAAVAAALQRVAAGEGWGAVHPGVISEIIKDAGGNLRSAIQMLETRQMSGQLPTAGITEAMEAFERFKHAYATSTKPENVRAAALQAAQGLFVQIKNEAARGSGLSWEFTAIAMAIENLVRKL